MARSTQTQLLRWIILSLIIAGGLWFRLSYNANTVIDTPIRADAANYLVYAHNLLDHATFSKDRSFIPAPDAYWAPGYPLYLAAILQLADTWELNQYRMILLSQALLGAIMILLTFLVGSTFLPGVWPLLPTTLVALSPHMISTASYILTETLFGFSLLLSIYTTTVALRHAHSALRWLLAGCCFAATYLVNPVALFLPFLVALVLLWHRSTSKMTLALLLLPIIITAAGWQMRTSQNVAEGQPNSSGRLLTNLASGIYPDFHDKWRDSVRQPNSAVIVPGDDIDSYPAFFAAFIEQFQNSPGNFLAWYGVGKPILLWSWDIRVGWGDIYIYRVFHSLYHTSPPARVSYSIMKSLHFWLFGAALVGMILVCVNRRKGSATPWLVFITLLYISGVYVCTQAAPRYSIPLRPEMYLMASYGLHQLGLWMRRVRQ